jgi:inosine-uridine nucleoside N-ribohydrolase
LKHVVIDTDPGVDDALALMLAFSSPEFSVEGVTTVVGNVSQEEAHQNALKLLEFLGVNNVPVSRGSAKPILREAMDATEIHGKTGLGDAILPEPKIRSDERTAVELILEKSKKLDGKLILVAIGPLTNIATAILTEPRIVKRAELVIMGGAFNMTPYGHGNVTPVAEFNIWHDPEAAKIVLYSGIQITAVGLDVTQNPDNRLSNSLLSKIKDFGGRRANLVADLCQSLVLRFDGLSLHDPLAVAAALDSSLIETKRLSVDVETLGTLTRGQTIVDRHGQSSVRGNTPIDVCVSVDSDRFLSLFLNRVARGKVHSSG